MGRRVVLHIGAMKTGTSYVQSVLGSNKDELVGTGVEFLGGFARQTKAVRDVLRLPKDERRNRRRWEKIARAAHEMDGHTGIVSMEFLSFAAPRHVEAFLAPLEGLDVRVLLTVRDQLRVVPAQWQTYTRNLGTDDWSGYLRAIEASPGSPSCLAAVRSTSICSPIRSSTSCPARCLTSASSSPAALSRPSCLAASNARSRIDLASTRAASSTVSASRLASEIIRSCLSRRS